MGRELYPKAEVQVPIERLGDPGNRWNVVRQRLGPETVLWTCGVGGDISWERALIERYGLRIYAFDPSPETIAWAQRQQFPDGFTFYPLGVADYDGTASFAPPAKGWVSLSYVRRSEHGIKLPVRRLATLQREFNLPDPDILKLDIEGAEYGVLADAITTGYRPSQFLVEFHHRFREVGVRKTREAIALLNQTGYALACVSPTGLEYTFVQRGET
jgi:FkbM family methyltransferase